jgi:hypothetical protein
MRNVGVSPLSIAMTNFGKGLKDKDFEQDLKGTE